MKLGEYFHQKHTMKADKAEWSKEKATALRTLLATSEAHWEEHMEYDIDGSAFVEFKDQTIDRAEWGGHEHIVMWTHIYCINVEIHSYGNDVQISD
eukprot:4543279-Heterocapsa_arctica.AAC.1